MKTQIKSKEMPEYVNRVDLHCCAGNGEWYGVYGDVAAIRNAFEQGHSAIAIVDHCSVRNYSAAARTAERIKWENQESGQSIKVIWGVEVDFYSNKDAGYAHIVDRKEDCEVYSAVLLAKNKAGLKNINRILSYYLTVQESEGMITRSAIEWLRDGLLIGASADNGEVSRAITAGESTRIIKQIASFYDFLEISPHPEESEQPLNSLYDKRKKLKKTNKQILKIGDAVKIPTIAVSDSSSVCADLNESINTTDVLLEEFSCLGDRAHEVVIVNPNEIANQVEDMSPIPVGRYYPTAEGAETKLKELSYGKAKDIYGINLPQNIKDRIEHELDIINKCGDNIVYYVNQEIAAKAHKEGNPVSYRGMIGASLVAFLCGITNVNPLPPHYVCPICKRYYEPDYTEVWTVCADLPDRNCSACKIPMNKYGFSIPEITLYGIRENRFSDIDLVVPTDYRDKDKSIVMDLLRGYLTIRAGKVIEANNDSTEKSDRYVSAMDEYGLFVVPHSMDIEDFTPFQFGYRADGVRSIITHQDWHNLDLPLLKLDVIGDKSLQILKQLKEKTGIEPGEIDLNDDSVLKTFSSHDALGIHADNYILNGGTYGIPDFDNDLFRRISECVRPTSVSEIIKCYGLSWGVDTWNDNIRSLLISDRASIGSIIASREDIYTYLCDKGILDNDAYRIMELARKNRELSETQIADMRSANVPKWWIESLQGSKYFSIRAQDVVRTITGIKLAWFKVYHASEFYSAWLSNNDYYHSHSADFKKMDENSLKQRIKDIKNAADSEGNEELKTCQVLYEIKARGL